MEHFRKITKLAALIWHIFMRTLQASFTSGRCLCLRHVFSSTIILRALWISCLFLLWLCITKPCTHLHPAPSTSTQLISAFTQLHPPPLSSFQPPSSSLQQPQQYLNQNIACNWAISPNLGRKIKSYPFWLKIGMHGILTMLILVPTLFFWIGNLNPFLGRFGLKKSKVVCFTWNLVHPHIHTQYLKDVNSYFDFSFLKF